MDLKKKLCKCDNLEQSDGLLLDYSIGRCRLLPSSTQLHSGTHSSHAVTHLGKYVYHWSGPSNQYNLRPRPKPLPRKSKRVLAEAASIAQPAHQEVLVRNAPLLQGIDAGTIPPRGVGDKQMTGCRS